MRRWWTPSDAGGDLHVDPGVEQVTKELGAFRHREGAHGDDHAGRPRGPYGGCRRAALTQPGNAPGLSVQLGRRTDDPAHLVAQVRPCLQQLDELEALVVGADDDDLARVPTGCPAGAQPRPERTPDDDEHRERQHRRGRCDRRRHRQIDRVCRPHPDDGGHRGDAAQEGDLHRADGAHPRQVEVVGSADHEGGDGHAQSRGHVRGGSCRDPGPRRWRREGRRSTAARLTARRGEQGPSGAGAARDDEPPTRLRRACWRRRLRQHAHPDSRCPRPGGRGGPRSSSRRFRQAPRPRSTEWLHPLAYDYVELPAGGAIAVSCARCSSPLPALRAPGTPD